MRDITYRNWLQGKISSRLISGSISRCRRIEDSLKLDLDEEFAKDGGRSLMALLKYSADDERHNRPAVSGIIIVSEANTRIVMASIRSAVKKYFEFCQSCR